MFENRAIPEQKNDTPGVVPWPQEPAENSLVEAAKRGHANAFGMLCERYTPQLFRAAHRITRSHEDAEDAVQDALMRAFVHVREFDGRSAFATWLTRITINSALMILRKKRTSLKVVVDTSDDFGAGDASFEIVDHSPNPEKRCAKREEERILNHAVDRLRPSLREIVRVRQLQERPIREAARVLGISVAAAKARLFQAKLALRKSSILKLVRNPQSGEQVRVLSAA